MPFSTKIYGFKKIEFFQLRKNCNFTVECHFFHLKLILNKVRGQKISRWQLGILFDFSLTFTQKRNCCVDTAGTKCRDRITRRFYKFCPILFNLPTQCEHCTISTSSFWRISNYFQNFQECSASI